MSGGLPWRFPYPSRRALVYGGPGRRANEGSRSNEEENHEAPSANV